MDISNFYGYPNYINSVRDWLPMDTEKLFNENYQDKDKRLLLEKYNWNKNSIKYKFNNYGFRCEDFKDVDNVVFLGCSHTIGIGIPLESNWTTLVSNVINLVPYNLGIGGGSWDTCFRLAFYWLEKLKPKIVIVMGPELLRMEWKLDRTFLTESEKKLEIVDWHNYGRWSLNHESTAISHFSKLITYEENLQLLKEKNKLAIENLAAKIKTKLLFVNKFYALSNGKIVGDLARDLAHAGVDLHKNKAEEIIKLI
jgi:hypothetical protein